MTIENYIRFVLRFLKENKVYYAFLYNVKEYLPLKHSRGEFLDVDCDNFIKSFSKHLYKRGNMKSFINWAFSWQFSREGFYFWEKINKKFENEYENEIEKERLMSTFYQKR